MMDKGVIARPFDNNYKKSAPVDVGEFKWTVQNKNGCEIKDPGKRQSCEIISCQPKEESRTILWSCSVLGMISATNKARNNSVVLHLWNASFGNRSTDFHAHIDHSVYYGERNKELLEVPVKIVDQFYADLSDPNNPLIKNAEDVAKFKIDGAEIYTPKKMLNAHSPFFAAYFKDNFKEAAGGFYELNDISLEDFLHFLGIVHGLKVHIDENCVESLLKLGDFFQCKLVLDRCEEFIKTAPVKRLPPLKKLQLAEQFKLLLTLADAIEQMPLEEMKTLCANQGLVGFSELARECVLMKLCMKQPESDVFFVD
ncbi:hypothetical protein L596_013148 [Steinernema carpocapsae]|uniref:BTB domain-containing protein n=1 Tax=Steinernema carpocapsae TaxID=34508 RepID=A0A4U5P047_STECR|nr:hypothetical protein L596_013148 [Steinernema carpocapsae]